MSVRAGRGIRALVTGGEHTCSLAAVRALRAADYEPWVGATSSRTYAARSRAAAGLVTLPYSGAHAEAFADSLRRAIERLGVKAVIPGTEQDLVAISSSSDSALREIAGLPPHEVVMQAIDKTAVYRVGERLGFSVPHTEIVDHNSVRNLPDARFPLIVKPVRSARATQSGALVRTDATLITSRDQLDRLLDADGTCQWLAQTKLGGQLRAISGVAQDGQMVAAIHQRSHRVWPPDAGVSAFAETVPADRALEAKVADLVAAMRWSGIFQVQFIHDDHGAHLIDFNPRVYGSLALATAAGVNIPAIWTALITGSPIGPHGYRTGVRYRSDELDLRALLHLALQGRPLAAVAGMLPRRHTAHSVITLADPAPGLTSLEKLTHHLRHARCTD